MNVQYCISVQNEHESYLATLWKCVKTEGKKKKYLILATKLANDEKKNRNAPDKLWADNC